MSNSQTTPEKSRYSGGFEDLDLTPKPLRIIKRGSPRNSGSADISPTLSTSSTQHIIVPNRSSSFSSSSTQIEPSPLGSASATTSWSGRRRSLQIHKQRRSDPVSNRSATASLRSEVSTNSTVYENRGPLPHYRHMSDMIDSGVAQRSSSDVQARSATRPAGSRALTIGALNTNNFPSPINDEPLPLAPTTVPTGGRRALTAVAPRGQGEATKHVDGLVLRREPSFKHRLITRMMHGLSHRSHISHARTQDPGRSPPILENSLGSHPQVLEAMDSSRPTSSSSGRTDTLDSALASFPTPPTSNEASPTAFGSFSGSHSEARRDRELCKPEETAIMGAELRLTAEYDELSQNNDCSMLVAIDIEGTMNKTTSGQSLWSQHTGLDVAVVIDNS